MLDIIPGSILFFQITFSLAYFSITFVAIVVEILLLLLCRMKFFFFVNFLIWSSDSSVRYGLGQNGIEIEYKNNQFDRR